MSNVRMIFIEDSKGDVVDIEYYHWFCSPDEGGPYDWPAPEAVDYPVFCAKCLGHISSIYLTEAGKREYPEYAQ